MRQPLEARRAQPGRSRLQQCLSPARRPRPQCVPYGEPVSVFLRSALNCFCGIIKRETTMKLHAVLGGILGGCLLGLTRADAVQADTPQLAVGRMTAAYNSLDLTNYMAVHARNFKLTTVSGKHYGYLPLQASIAQQFTRQTHTFLQCRLSSLMVRGNTAQGNLLEHYVLHQTRRASKYVFTQDVTADVFWVKGPLGWQMTSEQMSRDVTIYQRL